MKHEALTDSEKSLLKISFSTKVIKEEYTQTSNKLHQTLVGLVQGGCLQLTQTCNKSLSEVILEKQSGRYILPNLTNSGAKQTTVLKSPDYKFITLL